MGRAPFGHSDSFYCLTLTDRLAATTSFTKESYGGLGWVWGRRDFQERILGVKGLGGGELDWPYYAPNPLCGACFAKASQPEGAEDMSKGAR